MSAINLRASSFRPATTLRRPSRARRAAANPPGRAPAMRVEALRNFDYPEAILFDCDGVLCETERDGHRVTFNMTFKEKGLDHEWGVDQYGELLKIGGGKERMTHYFNTCADEEPFATMYPDDDDARKDYIKSLHLRKTDLFLEVVQAGKLPLRPGVRRLVKEALDNGAKVAVCSTSNEKAVKGIVATMLPEFADRIPVFAGDVVPKKKPAPDIYNLAAETLGVNPARCVVVEDTRIGLLAGKAAGMRVCVTKSIYSEDEDFSGADAVFDCIGDEGDERFSFHELTTPGAFWLNPPLPVDENGNWYRGGEGADEGADEGTTDEGTTDEGTAEEGTTDEDADGLTDAERAILADLDGPRR